LVHQNSHKPNKLEDVFLFEILPTGNPKTKKTKNVWPKEFWGKFLENSQNYEEEKGRRCHI
jgi:hypothetical protein